MKRTKKERESKRNTEERRGKGVSEGITCQRNVKHISNVCIEQLVFITRVETSFGRSGGRAHPVEWNVLPGRRDGMQRRTENYSKEETETTRIKGLYSAVCKEGRVAVRAARRRWRKGRGLARPHAVNTPQWRRNVTGFSSETFPLRPGYSSSSSSCPFSTFRTSWIPGRKSRGISHPSQISCVNTQRVLFPLQIAAAPGRREWEKDRQKERVANTWPNIKRITQENREEKFSPEFQEATTTTLYEKLLEKYTRNNFCRPYVLPGNMHFRM